MDGPDDERELRLFLERAVPHLPAPEERMGRVRGRVLRWRRRRRVAGAVAGVVAAAATSVLLRSTTSGVPGITEPRPAASPSSSSSPLADSAEVYYEDLGRITLRLPSGWEALSLPSGESGRTVDTLFTPDRVQAPRDRCPVEWGAYCLPPSTLREGGAVVVLSRVYVASDESLASPGTFTPKDHDSHTLDEELGKSCIVAGGTAEFSVLRQVPSTKSTTALRATVCVNGPEDKALRDVRDIVDSAVHAGADPTSRPATPPTTEGSDAARDTPEAEGSDTATRAATDG